MTKILVEEISNNKLVFHHQKPHVIIYNFDPSSPIKVTLSIFLRQKQNQTKQFHLLRESHHL